MRIAELINTLEIGGAERMMVDLACGLRERGHYVCAICLRGSGPLAGALEKAGVEVMALQKGSGFRPWTGVKLARYLRQKQIDIVHTHNPLVHHYGLIGARLGGAPVTINTMHGPGNLQGFGRTQLIFEASCLLSDQVVACCRAVDRHLKRVTLIPGRKSVVIANGIPLDSYTALERKPATDAFVFGAVGRLVPVKDHRTLLRAFAVVHQGNPACRLELLGDGPLRAELEAEARSLEIADAVRFHGASLKVSEFLSRIHVFVMSSLSEGLPLTVLEAMAAGLPVVGTSVGAIPELVEGADCGWVAPPNSPGKFAEAMRAALGHLQLGEVGLRGRRYAQENYSVAKMVAGYEKLFEEAVGGRFGANGRRSGGK